MPNALSRGGLTLAVDNVEAHSTAYSEAWRIAEALLFASAEPMRAEDIASRLPTSADVHAVLADLQSFYVGRGMNLVRIDGRWAFRTAPDLAYALASDAQPPQKLSRAAMEVLAIIAYHQPTTRAEIEEIRGVSTSKGTLDLLLESGWVRMRGRRKAPGRPVTYGTTPAFLDHFGLNAVSDLPGLGELQALGLVQQGAGACDLAIPVPSDDALLTDTEEPLDADLMSLVPISSDLDG